MKHNPVTFTLDEFTIPITQLAMLGDDYALLRCSEDTFTLRERRGGKWVMLAELIEIPISADEKTEIQGLATVARLIEAQQRLDEAHEDVHRLKGIIVSNSYLRELAQRYRGEISATYTSPE